MPEFLSQYLSIEALMFGLICVVLAAIVIPLDWALLMTKDISVLGIGYGSKNRWIILLVWSVAAGIVGMLSNAIEIIQANLQGAIAVAVGWPIILTRIVDTGGGTPIQGETVEEGEVEEDPQ